MLFRYGKFTVDNLIHLVLDSTHDLQPTLWYICEYNSWRNSENWPITRLKSSSPSFSSSSQERDDAVKKDIAQREKDLIQREKDFEQKEKDLEQREKTLAYKEKNLAQKETLLQQNLLRAELREREALEFEQEAKIKLEEFDEKEQELEAEKEKLKKNKNKERLSTTSTNIPTHHDAENANDDDDENPTNETNNNDNNQWLLRFSNLQQRLETAYREIENLRRPVSSAGTITTNITTTTATANGDNENDDDNNDNDNNNNDNNNNNNNDSNEDNDNEKSSSIITSLQHELKLTKENAQKQKEENILLRKTINQSKNFDEQNVSSERNVSFLRRRKMDVDKMDCDEAASSVGNRWAPLNFRVERRMGSATTRKERREGEEEGIVGMIEMQKEFRFLGRLR